MFYYCEDSELLHCKHSKKFSNVSTQYMHNISLKKNYETEEKSNPRRRGICREEWSWATTPQKWATEKESYFFPSIATEKKLKSMSVGM